LRNFFLACTWLFDFRTRQARAPVRTMCAAGDACSYRSYNVRRALR